MSEISKILFYLLGINGILVIILLFFVRDILIKLGERDSYLMVSLISDLLLLKRISKKEMGKYDKLFSFSLCAFLLEILFLILMIILL
jgi:hypothetical protein